MRTYDGRAKNKALPHARDAEVRLGGDGSVFRLPAKAYFLRLPRT